MQDYQTAEDFFADESFQDFVLKKSQDKVDYWESFQNEHPELEMPIEEAKQMVLLFNPIQISDRVEKLAFGKTAKARTTSIKRNLFIGALILFLVVALGSYKYLFNGSLKQDSKKVTQSVIASAGQVRVLKMADGTTISLKPGSSISILGNWSEARHVILKGDGFFDVSHDSERPMSIETSEGTIRVLGTSFSVLSSKSYEIILNEGSIQWQHDGYEVKTLSPNQRLELDVSGPKISPVVASDYNSWIDSKLHFKDVKLGKVVDILRRSYDLEIEVKNPELLEKSITANIPKNDPVLMLEAIAAIYDITLVSTHSKYILQ